MTRAQAPLEGNCPKLSSRGQGQACQLSRELQAEGLSSTTIPNSKAKMDPMCPLSVLCENQYKMFFLNSQYTICKIKELKITWERKICNANECSDLQSHHGVPSMSLSKIGFGSQHI